MKEPTQDIAARLDRDAVRYQGNWFPHKLRAATEDGVYFVGDSAGHCLPLSGEGIRPAFYFGIAAAREIRAALAGEQSAERALAAYHRFSARHRPAFTAALALQHAIPRLPPKTLTRLLKLTGRQRPCHARSAGTSRSLTRSSQTPTPPPRLHAPNGASQSRAAI